MNLKRIRILIFSLICLISLPASASRVIFIVDLTGEICGQPGECWIDENGQVVKAEDTVEDETSKETDEIR